MSDIEFQLYDWLEDHDKVSSPDDEDEEDDNISGNYIIHTFGRCEDGKSVYCKIVNFTPYFYILLPNNLQNKNENYLKEVLLQMHKFFKSKNNKVYYKFKSTLIRIELAKNKSSEGFTNNKMLFFARLVFNNYDGFKKYRYYLESTQIIIDTVYELRQPIKFKLYEANLPPMLRCFHIRQISGCSWVQVLADDYKLITNENDKSSKCDIELIVSWKKINPIKKDFNAPFRIASFDIECNSVDGEFPQAKRPHDYVIQIGITYTLVGQSVPYRQYIACLHDTSKFDDITVVECCDDETQLMRAFLNEINNNDCDILTGYNIFYFDEKYMYDRCKKILNMDIELSYISKLKNYKCNFKEMKLSSSALGDNELKFWETPGRVHVDLMKDVQKTFNLPSYKLDYVASNYIRGNVINYKQLENYQFELNCNVVSDICINDYIHLEVVKGFISDEVGEKYKVVSIELNNNKLIVQGNETLLDELELAKQGGQIYWSQAKDDVGPKEIFKFFKGSADDRAIVAKYCVKDCKLVNLLINKLEVVTKNIEMANVCYVPLSFLFIRGQGIKLFSLCLKEYRKQGFIFPVIKMNKNYKCLECNNIYANLWQCNKCASKKREEIISENNSYEGAIVFDPIPNVDYEACATKDYMSLYPASIIQKNMSHETIVENSKYDNIPGITYFNSNYRDSDGSIKYCRFAKYQNNLGVIPTILDNLLKERKSIKKLMKTTTDPFKSKILDAKQLAVKITANSLYGQLGASTSPICKRDIAACTTSTGREMLILAKKYDEEKLPWLINSLKFFNNNNENEKIELLYNMELLNPSVKDSIQNYIINDINKLTFQPVIRYGDSVIGSTPLLLRNNITNYMYLTTIDNLGNNYKFMEKNNCTNSFLKSIKIKPICFQKKESSELNNIEVWTENGWTLVYRVIRHKLINKKLYKITTNNGFVIVTEDHSLIKKDGNIIKPTELFIGMELLHSFPCANNNDYESYESESFYKTLHNDFNNSDNNMHDNNFNNSDNNMHDNDFNNCDNNLNNNMHDNETLFTKDINTLFTKDANTLFTKDVNILCKSQSEGHISSDLLFTKDTNNILFPKDINVLYKSQSDGHINNFKYDNLKLTENHDILYKTQSAHSSCSVESAESVESSKSDNNIYIKKIPYIPNVECFNININTNVYKLNIDLAYFMGLYMLYGEDSKCLKFNFKKNKDYVLSDVSYRKHILNMFNIYFKNIKYTYVNNIIKLHFLIEDTIFKHIIMYKIVPNIILNSGLSIKKAFLSGLTTNNNIIKITRYSQLSIQSIYTLLKFLNYKNIIIDNNLLIFNNKKFFNNDQIINIELYENNDDDDEYVYDLTTYNHHFHAGVGSIIVHNTDSIFSCYRFRENTKQVNEEKALIIWKDIVKFACELIEPFFSPNERQVFVRIFNEYYGEDKIIDLELPDAPKCKPKPSHLNIILPLEDRIKQFIKEYMQESYLPWLWTLAEIIEKNQHIQNNILDNKLTQWAEHLLNKINVNCENLYENRKKYLLEEISNYVDKLFNNTYYMPNEIQIKQFANKFFNKNKEISEEYLNETLEIITYDNVFKILNNENETISFMNKYNELKHFNFIDEIEDTTKIYQLCKNLIDKTIKQKWINSNDNKEFDKLIKIFINDFNIVENFNKHNLQNNKSTVEQIKYFIITNLEENKLLEINKLCEIFINNLNIKNVDNNKIKEFIEKFYKTKGKKSLDEILQDFLEKDLKLNFNKFKNDHFDKLINFVNSKLRYLDMSDMDKGEQYIYYIVQPRWDIISINDLIYYYFCKISKKIKSDNIINEFYNLFIKNNNLIQVNNNLTQVQLNNNLNLTQEQLNNNIIDYITQSNNIILKNTITEQRLIKITDNFINGLKNFTPKKIFKIDIYEGGYPITDKRTLEYSIKMGKISSELVKKYLPFPHDLEYEKTFWPFAILTKKRYVGNKYEFDSNKYKLDFMGIVLKRRDNSPIVKEICGGIINNLINFRSPDKAKEFTYNCLKNMFEGKYNIKYFLQSKTLKSKEAYKDWTRMAHVYLADKISKREVGNLPQSGDRIEYAIIKIPPKNNKEKVLQGDIIETPKYIKDNNLEIDYLFYLTNQIMNPALQFLQLVDKQAINIFNEFINTYSLPKVIKVPKIKEIKIKEPKIKESKIKELKIKELKIKEPKIKKPKIKKEIINKNVKSNIVKKILANLKKINIKITVEDVLKGNTNLVNIKLLLQDIFKFFNDN